MSALRSILLCVVVACLARPARADTASEAELQYTLGTELYKQRRYQEALQHFIASNRLVPNANVVFNVAIIYGLLKREVDAYNWYETYLHFEGLDVAARTRGERARDALASKVAVLDVTTTPAGAELFIDRLDLGSVGVAPRRVAVVPGARLVLARAPGSSDGQVAVTAEVGAVTPAVVTLAPLEGVLVVESVPAGASVRREDTGETLGTTPLRRSFPVGEVRLLLFLEGHVDQQRVVTLKAGAEARLDVTLVMAASRVAALTVSGGPADARVVLRGKQLGGVPLTVQGLEPGTAALSVEADGHEPFQQALLLEAGGATRVDVQLAPLRQPARWLRWVGYGAGAVAVLTGLVLGGLSLSTRDQFFTAPTRERLLSTQRLAGAADGLVVGGVVTAGITLLLDLVIFPAPRTRGTVELAR